MISPIQRRRFDGLLEAIIEELPENIREVMEEVPLIVEDEPPRDVLEEMAIDPHTTDLCGLHWGIPITKRSVEHSGTMPDRMMLFRGPIMRVAGRRRSELETQVRITLLHEIGHHFGLDEDDLTALGYG
ncbi:MAG: metallopeptidase family protein [Planctomycetes bacterium]|nr:metallopeptidase family protein [Planctomycetota bacterium]